MEIECENVAGFDMIGWSNHEVTLKPKTDFLMPTDDAKHRYWSEPEYLELSERTNWLIEMSNGSIEVLDYPTLTHQRILGFMCRCLDNFVRPRDLGHAIFAAYPLRLGNLQFREPDILFALTEHSSWFGEKFATGADLVMEVVSEDRGRDFETKRSEYEQAGIPEYWIVDPREEQITILRLENGAYVAAERAAGERAESTILPGFSVDV